MNKRIEWLDSLKAIGIFFVVFAHCPISSEIITYIFSFHMPLFFFISGIFFNPSKNFKDFILKKLYTLIVPYFSFCIISYISWLIIKNYTIYKPLPIFMPIFSTLYGSNCQMNFMIHNVFMWFLPCLFMTSLLFYLIIQLAKTKVKILVLTVICFIIGILIIKYLPFYLPWGADTAFIACLFYALGYIFRDEILKVSFNNKVTALFMGISLILSMFFAFMNTKIDMNNFNYGNITVFLVASFAGIYFWTMFAKLIPTSRYISLIGQNSLLIFMIQYPLFDWINFISTNVFHYPLIANIIRLHQINPNANPILVGILYLTAPFILAIPLSFLIKQYCPYMIGAKKQLSN